VPRRSWKVYDGPLKGETLAIDASQHDDEVSFKLGDGRVVVYRFDYSDQTLMFVGFDPFA